MITKKDIESYITRIPPVSDAVREALAFLQVGELGKAAKATEKERVLVAYLRDLINKPVYGFKNEVKDVAQIFSILGVGGSMQALYNYLMNLLSPKEWHFFRMNQHLFNDLQAELSTDWKKIVVHFGIKDKDIEAAAALLPSAVIVSEALFRTHKRDVELLRSVEELDISTILKRLSGYTLFDISVMIARKWDMPHKIADIVQAASGVCESEEREVLELGKWMHLLLFYTLSQPKYINAELNDFLEFNVEYVDEIYEQFGKIMGLNI